VVLSLTGSGFGGIWNSGLWTTTPVRRFVGAVADGVVFIAAAAFWWWLVVDVFDVYGLSWRFLNFLTRARPEDAQTRNLAALIWTALALFFPFPWLPRTAKTIIGKVAAPVAHLVRSRFVGMGGSSTFGGLFNDWAHPHRPGQLMLGGSLYDPGWLVGRSDDRHFITIATSRSGEGRSAIIPNLLTWPGSALVIDPKGQSLDSARAVTLENPCMNDGEQAGGLPGRIVGGQGPGRAGRGLAPVRARGMRP
jgi:Type IV secretory system Conjugative DNA transfer